MDPEYLWNWLLPGYLITVAIETPVLLIGLSSRHSLPSRLIAGIWLTACTYPIVVLVLPLLLGAEQHWWRYITVAEIFAPVAECVLFYLAYIAPLPDEMRRQRLPFARDMIAVTLANLASFGLGMVLADYWPR